MELVEKGSEKTLLLLYFMTKIGTKYAKSLNEI